MKQSGLSNFAVAVGLVLFNLAASALIFFIVMPMFSPAGSGIAPAAMSAIQRNTAIVCFLFGTLCSFLFVFGTLYLLRRDASAQEVLDALRQPCLVVDENDRYLFINEQAEKALGLSRKRDIGKALESSLQGPLACSAQAKGLDLRCVVNRGGTNYHVLDNPLPVHNPASQGRARVILLRDVDAPLRIRDSFREISKTMAVLGSNTKGISESALRLAQGATQQDSSLAAISSSLDEFSKKIQGNTESAAKGSEFAVQAREVAERSGGEIAHALSAMNDVQDAGVRIARIVKLIDDIAFQTNLLALNASVEAARAGRQGKGFAVVADEVRSLAGRSAKAAKDTASMVEDVTERIGNASAYISRLEEMLRNIVQEAIRIADYSASAGVASSEQATAILQVNQELGQMNNLTRSTRTAAEQTSSSVGDLAKQVDELRRKVDAFNVDVGNAPAEHDEYAPQRNKTINLYDEPYAPAFTPADLRERHGRGAVYSYENTSQADDDFVAPFRKMAEANWDLRADANNGETPLSSLLQTDGFQKEYEDFLEAQRRETEQRGPREDLSHLSRGPMEYKTTREGDKVVKPEQNIHLDDSEFGRY